MKEKKELLKHKGLIAMENKINLLERKLLNTFFARAQDVLEQTGTNLGDIEFSFPLKEITSIIGYNSHNQEYIKESLRRLKLITCEWNILDEKGSESEWGLFSPLRTVRFMNSQDGVMCYYRLENEIKDRLLKPDVYGKINLLVQRNINKKYTLVLYEESTRALKNNSEAYTDFISIDQYRKIMGVEDGKYAHFKDLKKKVIKEPVDDLKAVTNINAVPEFKREGNTPTHIRFHLLRKETSLLFDEPENLLPEINFELPTIKFQNKEFLEFCNKNSVKFSYLIKQREQLIKKLGILVDTDEKYEDYLIYLMNYTNAPKKQKVRNKGKYFNDALKENWIVQEYFHHVVQKKKEEVTQVNIKKVDTKKEIDSYATQLMYEDKVNYTRSFLESHPEIIEKIKTNHNNLLSKMSKQGDLLSNYKLLLIFSNLPEISEHIDFSFPNPEDWKKDKTNQARVEEKTVTI